jgi:hypothetical protein
MSEIAASTNVPIVLSSYMTTEVVNGKTMQVHVRHVERNGEVVVEKVQYTTYNANGTLNQPLEDHGQVVDILL